MDLIILDRDSVINPSPVDCIANEVDWQAIPGSIQAISKACLAGYHIVVVTNQPGLATGKITFDNMHRIHEKMITQLAGYGGEFDAIFFCPHSDEEECDCRMPKPGMLKELARRLRMNLDGIPFVCGNIASVEAAKQVNALAVLVKTAKELDDHNDDTILGDIPVYTNLASYINAVLSR